MDTADACHDLGIQAVAVTAGYIGVEARREFYAKMDAANVDLKGFTDEFYVKLCGAHLQPVLDTLVYLHHETDVWTEITTLLIPGQERFRRGDRGRVQVDRARARTRRAAALHRVPSRLQDDRSGSIRRHPRSNAPAPSPCAEGLHYVYTGNVHDIDGGTTCCANCRKPLIVRDWHAILDYAVTADGRCSHCAAPLPGRFERFDAQLGRRRVPVRVRMASA